MVLMFLTDPVLLGVTVAVLVFAGVVIGMVVPRINRASRQAQEPAGVMGAALERMLGAFRTVKLRARSTGSASGSTRRPPRRGGPASARWHSSDHARSNQEAGCRAQFAPAGQVQEHG